MDGQLEDIFLRELLRQCEMALASANEFNATMSAERADVGEAFRKLDEIAVCSGRIAQILWPTQGDKARGDALRQLLNVADDSVLREKNLRNQIEHFDEGIDAWAKQSIGTGDVLRHWIPAEKIYALRGKEFAIEKIMLAVADLAAILRPMASVPHWKRRGP